MVALLQVVRLVRDIPAEGLHRGDVGTVVEVFRAPQEAYEVEFTDPQGRTTALATLVPADIEPVGTTHERLRASETTRPAVPLA